MLPLRTALPALLGLVALICGCAPSSELDASLPHSGKQLELFVGSAAQPPVEAAARIFERETGAQLGLHFGGSGAMLSQLILARRGDLYLPGSSDYMQLALREDVLRPETQTPLAYLIPAILVAPGNPRDIQGLADLAREGLRLGIARPDTVCVGLYAVEVLERAQLSEAVQPNVVTHAESCAKTAQLVALGQVDAVLGWRVFATWQPGAIEALALEASEVPRIGVIPAAVTRVAREPELAAEFLAFLASERGRAIFREHGYLTSVEEARAYALPTTPIGGVWDLPGNWKP